MPTLAGVFSVTPVRIFMTPKDRAIAVTLSNEGDQPVALQAELNVWTQGADGTDVLTPTDDLVLSPPIIKLAPKAKQVVRLASLKPADASKQLTYRLIVREIPEAATPGKSIQVPVALALSMPVFITPAPAARNVACGVERKGNDTLAVCKNSGTAYAQIREALLKREGTEARFEGGAYVLPGAAKPLALKSDKPLTKGAAQLAVTFDDGKSQSFDVTLP
ncbi:MAG: molecular chaperone [Betaproteobacteria bacterium]|nr:molecular chaperone [Betaproteobacteria bacterium]